MSRFTIRDTSNVRELTGNLKELDKNQIKVGILGKDSELSMIAAVHEYGTEITVTEKMRKWFAANGFPLKKETTKIVIPERSFLRSGFDESVDDIAKKIEDLAPLVLQNQVDPQIFMNMIGLEFAGKIQQKIRNLRGPANSDMTVERKGSSNPLVDSGRLVGSISHKIE
ncbi:hypothetical protein [Bacillus sp. JJ722]|uniref:hypothetical protein n=1 Tax=Bacillus sp. JJ722 TaxID=3122973 RepID=UPI002FFE5074